MGQPVQLEAPKKRSGASVNVYLLLQKENQILCHLRKNTGYCDGMWSFVAGHVEDGESATHAMAREAHEEIGIELIISDLKLVHIMHRQTNRFNIDLFFDCKSWQGMPQNCEPEKCEKIEFFQLDSLPSPMIDYHAVALKCAFQGQLYSEYGWIK